MIEGVPIGRVYSRVADEHARWGSACVVPLIRARRGQSFFPASAITANAVAASRMNREGIVPAVYFLFIEVASQNPPFGSCLERSQARARSRLVSSAAPPMAWRM